MAADWLEELIQGNEVLRRRLDSMQGRGWFYKMGMANRNAMIPLFGWVLQDMDCDVLMIHRNLIHWLPQDEDWYWYERRSGEQCYLWALCTATYCCWHIK
jgi:hypothetical protein